MTATVLPDKKLVRKLIKTNKIFIFSKIYGGKAGNKEEYLGPRTLKSIEDSVIKASIITQSSTCAVVFSHNNENGEAIGINIDNPNSFVPMNGSFI